MIQKKSFRWILLLLLAAILFLGCERKPGEKLYTEALAEWETGNLVRARALLEKSIRRNTQSSHRADAHNRLGLLLWEMGEMDRAVESFNESCRMDAGQYAVLCNLGVALSAQKSFVEAERVFREAALLQPNNPRPLAYAGVSYLQNGKWEDAGRNIRRALNRTPNDPRLQTLLALTELHTRGSKATLKRLQTVVREHPNYAPAQFNLASLYRHWLKNAAKAKQYYESYLKQSSAIDTFSTRARLELDTLGHPPPQTHLTFTPPKTPNREVAETNFQKALMLHRNGKLERAVEEYIRTLEQDDTYEQAFYNLGLAYYTSGEMSLAGEAFRWAVKLNPAFTDARYNAALVDYYHLDQTERALNELEIVRTQQPNYQPAIDLLALIKEQDSK